MSSSLYADMFVAFVCQKPGGRFLWLNLYGVSTVGLMVRFLIDMHLGERQLGSFG